ncbi:hypothetical protein MBOVb_1620 [Mycoplasmopsis bovis 1067]|nr:hypothetical protein MBOVb_1620 [Mycoplasmopsis bovis 1067]
MNLFRWRSSSLSVIFLTLFSKFSNISVLSTEKKYSISLLSRELPILDIDTFPLSLSINWRYSLDEYWLPWSECITKFLGKLTFLMLSINLLYLDHLKIHLIFHHLILSFLACLSLCIFGRSPTHWFYVHT